MDSRPAHIRTSDRIGTPLFCSETHAAAHEAALLYAAGQGGAAIRLLERETASAGGVPDKQAWLVLFSCYRHAHAAGRRALAIGGVSRMKDAWGVSA